MTHPTNTKRLIRLLSITLFSSLLFVGVPPAQGEILDGIVKSLSYCDDGLRDGISAPKKKVIEIAQFDVDGSGFPLLTATVIVVDGPTFTLSGNALARNAKSGVFQLFGDDGAMTEVAMNGKYKLNGEGTLVVVAGAFQAQDLDELCITFGKLKAKNNAL